MFTVALFLASLPAPDIYGLDCRYPEVRAGDALGFGVSLAEARRFRDWAQASHARMQFDVMAWNAPEAAACHHRECEWRTRAWSLLAIALDPNPGIGWSAGCPRYLKPAEFRRHCLDLLRLHIGDAAFYTGRMPWPTCRYRYTADD